MPLPEHQESSPQPSEAKADDGKRTEWKVVSIVRSSHEITPVRSTVLSKSPPVLSRSSSQVDADSDDDDDEELPESIPSMSRGPSLQSSSSSTSLRSNSFHHSSPSFTSTTSLPIPSSSPMILSSSPPHHHPSFGPTFGGLASFSSLSESNPDHPHPPHVTLSQDPDDLSDSDDELPPTDPNFGLGPGIQSPPSGDSDELPPILSDDDDFPPAPTLMRQTGYYKTSTSHGCSCLEPEERTETDSYMYSR
jgi:hypothetical protein